MIRFALHYFFFFSTYAVITPFFQVFLRARGFDESQVGVLQAIFALAGALGSVGVGHLADRFGMRRTLLLGSLVASAAALAPMSWLGADTFGLVALLVAMFGITYKSTIPLADALAASELADPTHEYGRARAAGSLGFIVMLWIIWIFNLIDKTSSTSILICFLVTGAISLPFMRALPDRHKAAAHKETRGSGHFDTGFWLLMGVVFLGQLGMASHYSFFSLFLDDVYHVDNPGWIWSLGAFFEMPMLFCGGLLLRRLGVTGMLACSLIAIAIRMSVYAAAPPLAAIVAAQGLHAFTFGMSHTAAIELIRRKVPRARQGLAMTLYASIVLGMAQMVGAAAGGYLVESRGYSVLYLVYAAPPLIGLALLLIGRRTLAAHAAASDEEREENVE